MRREKLRAGEKAIKIAISNAKGGVAKTTTAISLAGGLAACDYKVLFLDLDPQANATSTVVGSTVRDKDDITIFTLINDRIMKNERDPHDYIYEADDFDIVMAEGRMRTIEIQLDTVVGGLKFVKRFLEKVEDEYDFVVMDTPPNLNCFTKSALYACNGCICPVTAKKYTMDGLAQMIDEINEIKLDGNEKMEIYGLLLCMYNRLVAQDRQFLRDVNEIGDSLNVYTFKNHVRVSQQIERAIAVNSLVYNMYPSSHGAIDYAKVTAELLERCGVD